uniref:DUF6598 domain-containing protein n=2 Tax=Oryza punctata TaxID=4537 RepID=A0A0E0K8N5_ORYPU
MQGLSCSTLRRLCRRPAVGFFICSAPPTAVARRAALLIATPSALQNPLSRFAFGPWRMQLYFGSESENKLGKRDCTTTRFEPSSNPINEIRPGRIDGTESNQIHRPIEDVTEGNYKATDVEVIGSNHTVDKDVWHPYVYMYSRHRDGTIYKNKRYWDTVFCIDVTNREETQVEPMRFSVTKRCKPNPENCQFHLTCGMMQVFSLKLAKTTTNSGPVQLYGYIAARDVVDSMLNYVFNRSRDDPIVVQQGSIIEMTGPKRGIGMVADVIFEFDMRIKNGEKEEDDLQLIDGIIELDDNVVTMIGTPRTFRLSGDCGSVDMSMAIFENAVEATVEVAISELHYGFDLSISYVLSELKESEEFQLFGGTIGESCGLRRFVIAVDLDTLMHLKFKVHKEGSNVVEHCCSFESKLHGCVSQEIKLEAASILAKVTWSPLIA